jgi:hypothetical protein
MNDARAELVVLIPYRDRAENLAMLAPRLHDHLERQGIVHRLVVLEQAGHLTFNKGRLFNAGFDLHRTEDVYFCFHDVDLVPENEACDYSLPARPVHLSKYCSQFGYQPMYASLCGGVMLFNKRDFECIDGYSNEFWGWGGEDDELARRMALRGLQVDHREGRYRSLPHDMSARPYYGHNLIRLDFAHDHSSDGLTSLRYSLVDMFEEPLYTRYLLDVGAPPTTDELLSYYQSLLKTVTSSPSAPSRPAGPSSPRKRNGGNSKRASVRRGWR